MSLQKRVQAEFWQRFGVSPTFMVRAPGRVNLIGEHTDYNDGYVLPLAINRALWIALRPRNDNRVLLYSLDFPIPADFSLEDITHGRGWEEYVRGVAWELKKSGASLKGWEGVLASDIPVGAGLSSSAALEMATIRAFSAVAGCSFDPVPMASIGQLAENEWVGTKTGIMDQIASACGVKGHAILIDCRSLQVQPAPLPSDVGIIVLDTKTRRGLVDSAYNERRAQCESASRSFGVGALRDVSWADFVRRESTLDPLVARRARHVISENERVLQAVEVMKSGNKEHLGRIINASHTSLRDDFEVSSPELDIMVEVARDHPGCFGARMTGAGFGGCALAIVDISQLKFFKDFVEQAYFEKTNLIPEINVCEAVNGVSCLNIGGNNTL